MKKLTCEMCGSHDIVKQEGMYVCQHCGLKYDTEEAKKLFVEVAGAVKVDNSEKLQNYYALARRAKDSGNNEDGAKYYDLIRQEDPDNWEANFYSVYFKSMSCVIAHIESSAASLANCLGAVFMLIKTNLTDPEEQKAAAIEVCKRARKAAETFAEVACNSHQSMSSYSQADFVSEFSGRVFGAVSIDDAVVQKLAAVFGEEKYWVLKELTYTYSSATVIMAQFKRALKPMNPLDRAIIHGIMEERADTLHARYSSLHTQYKKKMEAAKEAEVDNIADVNERFKRLLEEYPHKAPDVFPLVTLTKSELTKLANDSSLSWAVEEKDVRRVKMLLQMGKDLSKEDIQSLTLYAPQDTQHEEGVQIINMLLDAGIVPKDGDYNENTDPAVKSILLSRYPDLKPEIKKETSPTSSGGCYVATAVYGSYDCPEVWTLRRFRDTILASTWYGRAFIRTYYAISPTLVKLFGDTQWFKKIWKGTLDRMVNTLKTNGIKDTPYADKIW